MTIENACYAVKIYKNHPPPEKISIGLRAPLHMFWIRFWLGPNGAIPDYGPV